MSIIDMVRSAVGDLGEDATNAQIRDYVWAHFCKAIDEKYVPVFRATMRGEEQQIEAVDGIEK